MTTIDLTEAATTLRAHFGPRFAASRLGGRQRLAAALHSQFALEANDVDHILAALARRRVIAWEAEPGIDRPCPGVLELFGEWLIQPERLQANEYWRERGPTHAVAP